MEGRRTSARTRRSIDGGVDGSLSLDVARVSTSTSPRSEQLLEVAKSKSRTSTRSARERAELAKTTRALKSRLELALFKVGRGWEGVRFERIEAAHQHQQHQQASSCNGSSSNDDATTNSSSIDLSDAVTDAPALSIDPSASTSRASTSAVKTTNNLLDRSAGHQEQLSNSTSSSSSHRTLAGDDQADANHALLSPIKHATANPTTSSVTSRQARSASTTALLSQQQQQQSPATTTTAPIMQASSSSMPAFNSPSHVQHQPTTRPATTRPTLTTSTSSASLDCNPAANGSGIAPPLSAPPTTTTFSSPVAELKQQNDEFATPATTTPRLSKRQRRESHQPVSGNSSASRKRTLTSTSNHHNDDPVSSPPASAVLNAAHLGHKRKVSQNTLWHQSRAILGGGIGAIGGSASVSNDPQVNASNAPFSNAVLSAGHPGGSQNQASYLPSQGPGSLTSPVRLKPGQTRAQQQQQGLQSSPYAASQGMPQQSPQGYLLQQQSGSSVSPAGSSSGGTIKGGNGSNNATHLPNVQTPRRPSAQMMMQQNAPHTIASTSIMPQQHHQYIPHQPSNLGLSSSSSSTSSLNNGQIQFNQMAPGSSAMMMQHSLSQQGQTQGQMMLPLQQQQQAVYTNFQSPQTTGQQQDYGYALYTQQPHILQTPQHAQGNNNHMMQHPHTAPQLQHHQSQQQQSQGGMLTVNGYGNDFGQQNGMTVFTFGDPNAAQAQAQLSPSYPQQQQQQMQNGYGNQMSPLNMSNGFRAQQQSSQPMSAQMGQAMSMQGLPSQQPSQQQQQQQHMAMMRSQSALSRSASDLSTFNGSQQQQGPPSLDHSSLGGMNSSQDSSSIDTSTYSHAQQSAHAAQIVAAQMANGPSSALSSQQHQGGANTRPGTATGPERETAAELMLYLAASPSPQQPSKKVGNTALGGGDLSQVKGRKLFGGNDEVSSAQQQQQQQQQQRRQSQAASMQNSNGLSKSQTMTNANSMQQDHNNPFNVQHTYQGMNDHQQQQQQAQNMQMQHQQQMYNSQGNHQLAQPFEYNQAMQFDPYAMMTAQGVTLDQEFGSGW